MKIMIRIAALAMLVIGVMLIAFSAVMIVFSLDNSGEMLNSLLERFNFNPRQIDQVKANILPLDIINIIMGICFIVAGILVDIHFEKLYRMCFGKTTVAFNANAFLRSKMLRQAEKERQAKNK